MHKFLCVVFILFFTRYAYADYSLGACSYTTNEMIVNLPAVKISLDPDAPIGTLFYAYTATMSAGSGTMHCNGNANQTYQQSYLNQNGGTVTTLSGAGTFPPSTKVYNTNVPGIGVIISKGSTKVLPFTSASVTVTGGKMPVDFRYLSVSFDVNLVKYSDITAGAHVVDLTNVPGIDVSTEFVNGTDEKTSTGVVIPKNKPFILARFIFGPGSIEILSATCNTPDVLVDLGARNIGDSTYKEGGKFATPWVDASIQLTNCPIFYGVGGRNNMNGTVKNNTMTLTLIPNNPTNSALGIMPIYAGGNAAVGVGIQLAHGTAAANTKVNFSTGKGTKTYTLTSSIGPTYTLPLVARYIQTASSINDIQPGAANGKMTYLIDYF